MTALLSAPLGAQGSSGYLYELLRALGASSGAARHVQDLLLRPVTIILILVVAAIVAHLGSSVIRRSLHSLRARAESRAGSRSELRPEVARDQSRLATVMARIDMFGRIAANIWRVVIWVIALLSILGVLGIDLAPFVAGATVLGATIGFGAQTLVKDYLSGFLLLAEDQFRIGDDIATASATGVVEEMTLRVTRLRGDDGTIWYVPNGDIRTLGNTSRSSSASYVDVLVPIGAPLDRTAALIEEELRRLLEVADFAAGSLEPPSLLGIEQVDAAGVTFRVALRSPAGAGAPLARAIRAAVTSRLLEEGILGPARPPAEAASPEPPPPRS